MLRFYLGAGASLVLAIGACTSKSDGTPGGNGATGGSASAGRGAGGTTSGSGGSGDAGSSSGGAAGRGGSAGSSAGTGGAGTGGAGAGGSSDAGSGGDSASGGTDASGGRGAAGGAGGAGGVGGTAGLGPNAGAANGGSSAAGEGGESWSSCGPNDEFESSTLDACWQILNGSSSMPLIEIAESDGALHLSAMGNQNGVWYQGATKSLVYQLVTASAFKLTTTAHSRKASDAAALPTKDLHVGGLMVRNPASMGNSSENYLFIMLGHSENNNGTVHQGIEFKSTVNGCSDWLEPDWGADHDAPDADLRICRLGAEFRNYKRVPGDGTWTLADAPSGNCSGNVVDAGVLTRSDMPDTVQVGLGLNFNAPSDLSVAFDYIHFEELGTSATAADCTTD